KTSSVSELDLWEGLEISHLGDTVYARQNIKKKKTEFAYLSRLDIKHQIWSWNGRLDNSHMLEGSENPDPATDNPKTTEAMKWEAWAFADRPDYAAYEWKENLLAHREIPDGYKPQVIFTDQR